MIKETESQTSGENQWRSQQKTSRNFRRRKVTISGGTQAMTRASQERSAKDILILEMGSNGGWENDYQPYSSI